MIKEDVILYKEPIDILNQLSSEDSSEMSSWQLAFLCGLIKEHRPEKILEIGVAAGGTTSVILNCISLLDIDTEVHSIDLSTRFYRDKNKETGYLARESIQLLNKKVRHSLHTGSISVDFVEQIGKGIDFLILDTAHMMPGEILDFLACLPYLKEGAVVVLHDIISYHNGVSTAFATQLLLDTVKADKLVGVDQDYMFTYPNIGAFTITKDTVKHIEDVFSALMITWGYCPADEHLKLYRDFYKTYYNEECIHIFDLAVKLNKHTLNKKKDSKIDELVQMHSLIEEVKEKRVYIYGCGNFGKKLNEILKKCDVDVLGYIVSDGQKNDVQEVVYYLSQISVDSLQDVILIGVNEALQGEISKKLCERGITEYIVPNQEVCKLLERL